MPTQQKVDRVQNIKDRLERSSIVMTTSYAGISVNQMIELRRAMRATEQGMQVAVETIKAAQVRDQTLYWEGKVLTSERLRQMIHLQLLQLDCMAQHTIVAGGTDGCDPHQEGSGPLRVGEPIIIDIFPREAASGYFGDITRTVCKGTAPGALRTLYDVVHRGQQLALEQICLSITGKQAIYCSTPMALKNSE